MTQLIIFLNQKIKIKQIFILINYNLLVFQIKRRKVQVNNQLIWLIKDSFLKETINIILLKERINLHH